MQHNAAVNKHVSTPARGVAAPGAMPSRAVELRMYNDLPTEDVTLEEFERLALERLRGECRP